MKTIGLLIIAIFCICWVNSAPFDEQCWGFCMGNIGGRHVLQNKGMLLQIKEIYSDFQATDGMLIGGIKHMDSNKLFHTELKIVDGGIDYNSTIIRLVSSRFANINSTVYFYTYRNSKSNE